MLVNFIEAQWIKGLSFAQTVWLKIVCKLKGVSLGRKNRFFGLTKFTRVSKGTILIGDFCTFRSSATSNLIGINRPCMISAIGNGEPQIIIGKNCGFSGTVIGAFDRIELGDYVRCGANTLITDGDWHENDPRAGKPRPVTIGHHVWLGVNVIVLKGVIIGANSLIGANSVVTKDIPANVIAAGNPCVVIRELKEHEIISPI